MFGHVVAVLIAFFVAPTAALSGASTVVNPLAGVLDSTTVEFHPVLQMDWRTTDVEGPTTSRVTMNRGEVEVHVNFHDMPDMTVKTELQPLAAGIVKKFYFDYRTSFGKIAIGRSLNPASFVDPSPENLVLSSYPYTDPLTANVTGVRFAKGGPRTFIVAGLSSVDGTDAGRASAFVQYRLPHGIKVGLVGETTFSDSDESTLKNWGVDIVADCAISTGAFSLQATYMNWEVFQGMTRAWMAQPSVRVDRDEFGARVEGQTGTDAGHRYTIGYNRYVGQVHRLSVNLINEGSGDDRSTTLLFRHQVYF